MSAQEAYDYADGVARSQKRLEDRVRKVEDALNILVTHVGEMRAQVDRLDGLMHRLASDVIELVEDQEGGSDGRG